MVQHNSVPTTCTASQISHWNDNRLRKKDPKSDVNNIISFLNDLKKLGFKEDFAILFAITTISQVKMFNLEEIMPKIGFEKSFEGLKSDDKKTQRHQETGDLVMWCARPAQYKKCLEEFLAEMIALKDKIDPPKKADPKRQEFPDLLLSALRKKGFVQDNTKVDNPIHQVLLVEKEKVEKFLKIQYGFDVKKWRDLGDGWTRLTTRQLKQYHMDWKNELV